MEKKPHVFGVRHLSPAGAYHLCSFLDEVKPEKILIEGPSDFTELIADLTDRRVKPPVAIMAYTTQAPILSILYPFAVYSPEYQALVWGKEHGCECQFIDLPSKVFLALQEMQEKREQKTIMEMEAEVSLDNIEGRESVYHALDQASGEDDHETFWEHVLEHSETPMAYLKGAYEFGYQIRKWTEQNQTGWAKQEEFDHRTADKANDNTNDNTKNNPEDLWEQAETILRESYMKRKIEDVINEGIEPEKIVIVTGAYHVTGLLEEAEPMSDAQIKALPGLESRQTLMPYSYYRLSARSGYGAGNKAPAYYELLWQSLQQNRLEHTAHAYLTKLAAFQRRNGNPVSSAEVIEAVRLAGTLAELHGYHVPSLRDLRDAAVTCMGHGQFSELALAAADTEIGTKIGSLPEGVSQTSVQSDFYQNLERLRLTKYKTVAAEELQLDLREKLTVKSEKSAFLDLERSFFLHKLRVLGISFAVIQNISQEKATWAEKWILRWTPEAEMQIVETVLKGDTIAQAASFELQERVEKEKNMTAAAAVIEEAFFCGMPASVRYATRMLQEMAVDAASIQEIAKTARSLSVAIQYGDIRRLDAAPLLPLLSQLFLRACLIFPDSCICDDEASKSVSEVMESINEIVLHHDFLEEERWIQVLEEIAQRDDLNTKLSGFAAAILLERGKMGSEELGCEVERRLSRGIPAELGAGWFEGLALKNHYALIARMTLWEKLSDYLDTLDKEEFKRALVFLRRAFADFSSAEKNDIAENLGEIWQVNPQQVSEVLNETWSETQAKEMLENLDEFDFDDI